jgi:uncharacterized protein (DUF488 family)
VPSSRSGSRSSVGAEVARTLLTFGHGTAGPEELLRLLLMAGVTRLIDVRRFPASRRHPHVSEEALAAQLPSAGIGYRWDRRLGGRRRVPPGSASPDTWWQVEAFRAYAWHTRTAEFDEGLRQLLAEVDAAEDGSVAVMCSESVWWRCHRRLICDVAVLTRECRALHLMHDGRLAEHPTAAGARAVDGSVVWDGS